MTTPLMPTIARALREGRADDAERLCGEALRMAPADAALLQASALVAATAGRPAEALARARMALARSPGHVPTLVLAGRSARQTGDLAGAAALLRQAVDLAPDRAEPAFLLCVVCLEHADPHAVELLHRLVERFPAHAAGWVEIGGALQRARKPEAALSAFRRALQAEPSTALLLQCAALLRELGSLAEARDTLEQAAELGQLPPRAWFLQGLTLQDLGDLAGAGAAYGRALDADPSLAEAAVNLGIVRQQSGDLAGATAAYGRALRSRPDTFGRIAQAMTSSAKGELWLDLRCLRRSLLDR